MLSEKEIHDIQTSIMGRMRELRRLHKTWLGYKQSFASKLQEWDSCSDLDGKQDVKRLFPVKEDRELTSGYNTREDIMERARKVDSALQEVIREGTVQFSQICNILGLCYLMESELDENLEVLLQLPLQISEKQTTDLCSFIREIQNYLHDQLVDYSLFVSNLLSFDF